MRSTFRLLSAIALLSHCPAIPQTIFQRSIGGLSNDNGDAMVLTGDGAIVVAGSTVGPNAFDMNMFLVKWTIDGDIIWSRSIGGPGNPIEAAYSVEETSDGGFILCGTGPPTGNEPDNLMLVKTDAMGQVSWAKSYGGPILESGSTVHQTADGGYITLGRFEDDLFNADILLIKTDTNGDSTWTRTLSAGIDIYDDATSVQQTADGGYVITGSASTNGSDLGAYLIKTNSIGNVSWAKMFGGNHRGNHVQQTADGGYIVLGTTGVFDTDIFLIRTDPTGDIVWTRTYSSSSNDSPYTLVGTSDGGFIIAASSMIFPVGFPDAYLLKTDANGDLIWSKAYGGDNYNFVRSVQQTPDGGYVAAGSTASFGSGLWDMYLLRTDELGNSGCNEIIAPTVVSTLAATITDPVLQSSSGMPVQSLSLASVPWGTMATLCLTSGLNEAMANDPFLIFPNPTSGLFTIRTNDTRGVLRYEIVDMRGKVVKLGRSSGRSDLVVDGSGLDPGSYVVSVSDGGLGSFNKLIIEPD